jgi:hypothetical protein
MEWDIAGYWSNPGEKSRSAGARVLGEFAWFVQKVEPAGALPRGCTKAPFFEFLYLTFLPGFARSWRLYFSNQS